MILPKGYLPFWHALRLCEQEAEAHRSDERLDGPPFGGDQREKDAGRVLEEALATGDLFAAVMRDADGTLVYMPPASWRASYFRPAGEPWDESASMMTVPTTPFREAAESGHVPAARDAAGNLLEWGTVILPAYDLAIWLGQANPPAQPTERPPGWPAPQPSSPATGDLDMFVTGAAIGALVRGAPLTRDELRDIITTEHMGTTREADAAFGRLHARHKNADRSKGSNRPK